MRKFDFTKWQEKFLTAQMNYVDLRTLVGEPALLQSYVDRKHPLTDMHSSNVLLKALRDYSVANTHKSLASASVLFSRQMLILSVTYIEAMMQDCFVAFFDSDPSRMHEYLRGGKGNEETGILPLADVIRAGSKEELLASLADRAARSIIEGRFPGRFSRLKKLTKLQLKSEDEKYLSALVERRNRLVHGIEEDLVGPDDVNAAFSFGLLLNESIATACTASGVEHNKPAPRRIRKRLPRRSPARLDVPRR